MMVQSMRPKLSVSHMHIPRQSFTQSLLSENQYKAQVLKIRRYPFQPVCHTSLVSPSAPYLAGYLSFHSNNSLSLLKCSSHYSGASTATKLHDVAVTHGVKGEALPQAQRGRPRSRGKGGWQARHGARGARAQRTPGGARRGKARGTAATRQARCFGAGERHEAMVCHQAPGRAGRAREQPQRRARAGRCTAHGARRRRDDSAARARGGGNVAPRPVAPGPAAAAKPRPAPPGFLTPEVAE